MGPRELLIPLAIAVLVIGLGAIAPLIHPLVIAVVVIAAFIWANPLLTVIEYWLRDDALEVTIFRFIRLGHIRYDDIVEVRRARWFELVKPDLRWAESLGSNIFRPLVLIRRKKGRRRAAIITPEETDSFVTSLQAKIDRAASPGSIVGVE